MTVKYSDIAADIKAKLETLPAAGLVHAYERQASDLGKFIALFKDTSGKILGCEITRRAVPEAYAGVVNRQHAMEIHYFMGLQDASASSVEFQDNCDDICDLFRAAQATGFEYRNALEPGKPPVQLALVEDRMFGAVLCHTAIITLSVTERILP